MSSGFCLAGVYNDPELNISSLNTDFNWFENLPYGYCY